MDAYTGGKRPCLSCRKSKVRCDRGSPCGRCRRLGLDCTEQVRTKRGLGRHAKKTLDSSSAAATRREHHYSMGRSESATSLPDYASSSSTSTSPFPLTPGGEGYDGGVMMCGSSSTSSIHSLEGAPSRVVPPVGILLLDQAPSPVQAVVDSLLKLNAQSRADRSKALAVMRSWGLSCLKHQSDGVAQQLGRMATALGVDWRTTVAATTPAPEQQPWMTVGVAEKQEAEELDPFVKDLFNNASAAAGVVTVQGEHRFHVNEAFAREFAESEECESMFQSEHEHLGTLDVLGRSISSDDKADFFDAVGTALFTTSDPCSEMAHICRVETRHGESYMVLARLRFVVRDSGNYSAVVLSFQRLPPSRYLFAYSPAPSEQGDAVSATDEDRHQRHYQQQQPGLPVIDPSSSSCGASSSNPRHGLMFRAPSPQQVMSGGGVGRQSPRCPLAWMDAAMGDVVDQDDLWGAAVPASIKSDIDGYSHHHDHQDINMQQQQQQQPQHQQQPHQQMHDLQQHQQPDDGAGAAAAPAPMGGEAGHQQQHQQDQVEPPVADVLMLHFLDNLF